MLIALAGLLAWRLARVRQIWDLPSLFAASAFAATAGHFGFASVGWLFRYEAWLIVLNLVAICLFGEQLLKRRGLVALAVAIMAAFVARTSFATVMSVQAIGDRRLEHLAPARFVDLFYSGRTIMANDIGAIAWFAPRTRLLDIYGLGNNEPVRRRLSAAGYDAASVRSWAIQTGARIAILQPCWREARKVLPAQWALVATWQIPRNVVFGDRVVGFFAVAPDEQEKLRRNLEAFSMPPGVTLRLGTPRAAIPDLCW